MVSSTPPFKLPKTLLKRSRFDDKNDVFRTVFGFRNSGCGGLPLLVRDLAHGPRRGSFQSHLGGLGRKSTELLNLTITEISSTKPRRANKNSQGSQRSWPQGAKSKKRTRGSQISSHPTIDRSIDRSIHRSINESTSSQVKTSNKKTHRQKTHKKCWQTKKTIKQVTRHTIANSTIQKYSTGKHIK